MSADDYVAMVLSKPKPETIPVKTHAHCKVPGCMNPGAFQPYDFAPNVRFCDHHAMRLIGITVFQILTKPEED